MIEKEGHKERHECLWGRAILPNWLGKGTARTRFAEDIMMLETENYNQLNAECKESASDGSGGPGHVPKAMRKVGAAAVIIKANRQEGRIKIEDVAFMMSEVTGKQTVPRAEVLGDIMANIEPDEKITHEERCNYSDASYVVNGASKNSKKSLVDGPNGDLWEVRESMREENKNNRETKKIKSHAQKQVLKGKVNEIPYLMNMVADAAADAYADTLSTAQPISEINKWQSRAFQIARRLAVIQTEIDEQRKDELQMVKVETEEHIELDASNEVEKVRAKMKQQIKEQGHRLVKQGRMVRCTFCQTSRGSQNIRYFTVNKCNCNKRRYGDQGRPSSQNVEQSEKTSTHEPLEMWVTQSKRKDIVRKQLQKKRARERERLSIERTAAGAVFHDAGIELPDSETEREPPFKIHKTHAVIELGGFYACTRCGKYNSKRKKDNTLPKECAGKMPKGNRSTIDRIKKGRHPERQGKKWPSGEECPKPKRYKAKEPEEDEQ